MMQDTIGAIIGCREFRNVQNRPQETPSRALRAASFAIHFLREND